MSKRFKESKLPKRWLGESIHDFKTALLNHRHGGFTDTTCYFCHQTAEKALKAFLLSKKLIDFPHVHILPVLLNLCMKFNKGFKNFKKHIKVLDRYYIETKYPSDIPTNYPKQEAEKAIAFADEVLEFIKRKV